MNAGDPTTAADLYFKRDRSADDARTVRFNAALDKAWHQQTGDDPAADFIDRVQTYWLPEVAALPNAAPADQEGWTKLLNAIDVLAGNAVEGEKLTFTPAQRAIANQFLRRLGAKQALLYPALRRHVASQLRSAWFRTDIGVSANGARAELLRLTSAAFVRNANIEDVQRDTGSSFLKARFRRVEYRWSRHWTEGYHYDLKPPADAIVATWDTNVSNYHVVRFR